MFTWYPGHYKQKSIHQHNTYVKEEQPPNPRMQNEPQKKREGETRISKKKKHENPPLKTPETQQHQVSANPP